MPPLKRGNENGSSSSRAYLLCVFLALASVLLLSKSWFGPGATTSPPLRAVYKSKRSVVVAPAICIDEEGNATDGNQSQTAPTPEPTLAPMPNALPEAPHPAITIESVLPTVSPTNNSTRTNTTTSSVAPLRLNSTTKGYAIPEGIYPDEDEAKGTDLETKRKCRALTVPRGRWRRIISGTTFPSHVRHEFIPKDDCAYDAITSSGLKKCLARRTVLFLGDAAATSLGKEILRMFGQRAHSEAIMTPQFLPVGDGGHIALFHTRFAFEISEALRNHTHGFFAETLAPNTVDDVVVSNGVGDMTYLDPEAAPYQSQLSDSLRDVTQTFPNARIWFVKTPRVFPTITQRNKWRTYVHGKCLSLERQYVYRAWNQCVLSEFETHPIIMSVDFFNMTNTMFALQNVDVDRHHWNSEILTMMLRVLFTNGICVLSGNGNTTTNVRNTTVAVEGIVGRRNVTCEAVPALTPNALCSRRSLVAKRPQRYFGNNMNVYEQYKKQIRVKKK